MRRKGRGVGTEPNSGCEPPPGTTRRASRSSAPSILLLLLSLSPVAGRPLRSSRPSTAIHSYQSKSRPTVHLTKWTTPKTPFTIFTLPPSRLKKTSSTRPSPSTRPRPTPTSAKHIGNSHSGIIRTSKRRRVIRRSKMRVKSFSG